MDTYRCIDCDVENSRVYFFERDKELRCINCHIVRAVPTKWVIESDFMRKKGWHIDAGYDENVWDRITDKDVRDAAISWYPGSNIRWPDGTLRPTFYSDKT